MFEVTTYFLRARGRAVFRMSDIEKEREFVDALTFPSPLLSRVAVTRQDSPIKGEWYRPPSERPDGVILYYHGGGYAFNAVGHQNLLALVTLATQTKLFVPDYRLIPEHPFPAQQEDAVAAYRWLLDQGFDPSRIILMGDSAGGHLVVSALLALRDQSWPLPSLGVCLSPWIDLSNSGESMSRNEKFDWINKRMADSWAKWFCAGKNPRDPSVSPINVNLRGLPELYLQAGNAEILHDMIRIFEQRALQQGVKVTLDVWDNMNHEFHVYGNLMPQSREALNRIAEMVGRFIPPTPNTKSSSP